MSTYRLAYFQKMQTELQTTAQSWFNENYTRCLDLAEPEAAKRVHAGGIRGTQRRPLRRELIRHLVDTCPEALEYGDDVWGWFVEFVIEPEGSRHSQYRPFKVWKRCIMGR